MNQRVIRLVTTEGRNLGLFPSAAVTEIGKTPQAIADALAADPNGIALRDQVHTRYETSELQQEFDALEQAQDSTPEAIAFEALRTGNTEEE